MSINDRILNRTGGPTINDGLLTYYQAGGAVSNDLNGAEREYLLAQGAVEAQLQDMWFEYLGSIGHSGSLDDRKYSYWGDIIGLDPDVTLFFDFAADRNLIDQIGAVNLSFTRNSLAYDFDENGDIVEFGINVPRFGYTVDDSISLGLGIDEASENTFLDSDTPATQDITTLAQVYTVSVYGEGSIELSGTMTGTVVQGFPITATATAGTLTCTVSGSLIHAQVEPLPFATSPMRTVGVPFSRVVENCFTNIVTWYNSLEGTLYARAAQRHPVTNFDHIASVSNGTPQQLAAVKKGGATNGQGLQQSGLIASAANAIDSFLDKQMKIALRISDTDTRMAANGILSGIFIPQVSMPIGIDRLNIGGGSTFDIPWNGYIQQFAYADVGKDDQTLLDITS